MLRNAFIVVVSLLVLSKAHARLETVMGGGIGGNLKTGKLYYDGLLGHLKSFPVERYVETHTCYLENDAVMVKYQPTEKVFEFDCPSIDFTHRIYWNQKDEMVNGGYSPQNDVIFAFSTSLKMYQDWFGLTAPVLRNHKPAKIRVYTHEKMKNAYWLGDLDGFFIMLLGDGDEAHYPFTSLSVLAHELAHGFTQQHSDLTYEGESGGLNESFSDMAALTTYFYVFHRYKWEINSELLKEEGKATRYMDNPLKDCAGGKTPGVDCSIINVKQIRKETDVHYSSGIFNRIFYLIVTTPGWDAKKAFRVMLQANQFYWTHDISFQQAACGVIKATNDFKYDVKTVKAAIESVGLNTKIC